MRIFLTVFILHLCAVVKNVASGLFFLNGDADDAKSCSVIEKGVEWEYDNDNDKESLQSTGPLRHGILIMVNNQELYFYLVHT